MPRFWLFCLLLCLFFVGKSFAQKEKGANKDSIYNAWSESQDRIEDAFIKNHPEQVHNLVFYNMNRAAEYYSDTSKEYRTSIFYLAKLYELELDNKNAEKTYLKTKAIFEKLQEENTLDYAILIRQLGKFYQNSRKYVLADSLLRRATELVAETNGKRHKEYAICLSFQADYYNETGEYESAISILEQLGNRYTGIFTAFEHISMMIDLGYSYELMGRYADALNTYDRCENYESRHKKDANSVSNLLPIILNGQARTYEELGDYDNAKKKYTSANSLFARLSDSESDSAGVQTSNYRIFLEDLAAFYRTIGEYKNSEEAYKKVASMNQDIAQQAKCKNDLGMLYESMGQYPKAEELYLESRKLYESMPVLKLDQHSYANLLSNLAGLYELIGKYKQSEKLYLQAKQLDELTVGQNHPDYAATLNNLAKLYMSLQDYKKAEGFYERAKIVLQNTLGERHPNYVRTRSNQALLFQLMERYEEAETTYEEVLALQRKLVGNKHPDYATTLNRMAGLYKMKGDSPRAKRYYEQAKKLRLEILGEQHPDYAITLNEYAQLHHYLGNEKEAFELFTASNRILLAQLQTVYPILSEPERLRFFSKQEPHFDAFYGFAVDYLSEIPQLAIDLQNLHAVVKGLALETTISSRGIALNSNNDSLIYIFNTWTGIREKISKVYSMSLSEQGGISVDSLVDVANDLEAQLSKKSEYFRKKRLQNKALVNFQTLRKSLNNNEVIIDFLCFRYHNGRSYTNEIRYYAAITHNDSEQPQWIRLADEAQLKKLLDRSVNPKTTNYSTSTKLSYTLYRQIWMPLEPFLGNTTTIHLSPAGLLNKVSFAALMPDSSFLIEKYELAYYSNLRDLLRQHEKEEVSGEIKKSMVLLGDPAFNTALALMRPGRASKNRIDAIAEKSKIAAPISFMQSTDAEEFSGNFDALAGTRIEIMEVQKLFDSLHWETKSYLGVEVLEERIKEISQGAKPSILHIATHGYFFPHAIASDSIESQRACFQEKLRYAINPLWRSGLAFSGANYTWRGVQAPPDMEDGILMSYEVANLNLFGIYLAVLSACDTGRGDLHNSEGVLGLQRAFKASGVQHLLISLWRVPDVETSQLMQLFYAHYLSGMPIRQAFRAAQMDMIRKGHAPFYWAGFILVE